MARLTTMDAMISETAADRRFTLLLFEIFALSALALTAAGVYGMMAGIVAERTREFGLRAAVGATPGRIVALVFSFGARVTSVGLVIGVVAVVLGLRGLRTMLYGVSHLDVITRWCCCSLRWWRAWRVRCRRFGRRGLIRRWRCGLMVGGESGLLHHSSVVTRVVEADTRVPGVAHAWRWSLDSSG